VAKKRRVVSLIPCSFRHSMRMTMASSKSSSRLPKEAANKYAFDAKQKVFELTKVLPAGMAFPYDFGFIPSTLAEDGDPTDVWC